MLARTSIALEHLAGASAHGPCELVEGELLRMAPAGDAHGFYEGEVHGLLRDEGQKRGLGIALCGEVGVIVQEDRPTVLAACVAMPDRA